MEGIMAKIIVKNADKFSVDCDLAGTREFLFGMYNDIAMINGIACEYHEDGYIKTDNPTKVANYLNCTGDWRAYPERPKYEVVE